MKKSLVLLAAVLMLGLTGCVEQPPAGQQEPDEPVPADEMPEYNNNNGDEIDGIIVESQVFRVSESQPMGFPTEIGLTHFANRVAELTNNEIIIRVHAGGVLGSEADMLAQVRSGELEMIRVPVGLLHSINPDVDALTMPFLYRDSDHVRTVLDGEIGTGFLDSFRDGGLVGLNWFDVGARSFYFTEGPVTTVAEMRGLDIRVPGMPLVVNMIERLGGVTTEVPFNDINEAFDAGIIDAAESSFLSFEANRRFIYAPYLTLTEHIRIPEILVINADLFDGLSAEHQEAMRTAAWEAGNVQREEHMRQEQRAEDIVVANGTVITRLTEEQRRPFFDAMLPLYEEFAHLSDIIEAIRAH